jgi:hypothetical protein
MKTFAERMEMLATEAGKRAIVFKLLNGDHVALYEPFSVEKDHVEGAIEERSRQRWTVMYRAIASVHIHHP